MGDIMDMVRATVTALIIGSLAYVGGVMAQGVDLKIGVGIPLAPGLSTTSPSPGKAYNFARDADSATTSALPPGKLYLQNQANESTTPALPPGQTFTNYGRTNNNGKKP